MYSHYFTRYIVCSDIEVLMVLSDVWCSDIEVLTVFSVP